MSATSRWSDTPEGYGPVSRAFHWGMTLLIVWQFTSALLRVFAEDTAIEGFFWSTHVTVGFTIWWLAILRGAWGLANLSRRPRHHGPPLLARAATLGHLALYALLILVPSLAIARAFGNGRGFTVYGLQLAAPGEPNPALTAPGNALHGLLGWVLLALVVGHVAMALWHGYVRRDGTLEHMTRGRGTRHLAGRA